MPFTHVKTVTVSPADDQYNWSVVDDSTNSTATWVTVTQQGSTDSWDFLVQDNTGSPRSATATVNHSNGVTTDSFDIAQAGPTTSNNTGSNTFAYSVVTGAPTSIFSTGFTMHGDPDYVDANGNAGSSPGTCPRGFLWGTDQNNLTNEIIDTTSSNNNSDPATFMGGTMAYSYALGGLNASTAYYYRAFISTGSDICDGGSNPGTRIYGDIRALTTAAPQLAFTAFDTYIGTSSPETLGDTVTEQSGQNRIFFKITASQDLAGMKIPVVSLNIIAPSAGAGDIGDFSISNSMLINGSTINDLAPIEFGGGGGASNNEAITMLQLIADNKTEGNETYRLTISPNYVDAAGNVQGQHGLNTSIDFIINDTSIYQPTDIGYGLTPYNLLGSPVVTTTNGVTVSKYTFDNTNGTYGPNHIIFLNTYDDLDPIIHTSDTTTQNTVYWSNDPNGATNDHSSINGSGNSAIVSNTTVDTNQTTGTGTGFVNNNASVVFDDGAASSGMPELNEGLISG